MAVRVITVRGDRLARWRVTPRSGASLRGDGCRAPALARAAGHGGSSEAREGPHGGGAERRAYSVRSNIASETEESQLRSASRRAAWVGRCERCVTGECLWRDATCCQTCVVANPRRVHVNNYVKRLVLKHEPRSLAPPRAFGWIKPDLRKNA